MKHLGRTCQLASLVLLFLVNDISMEWRTWRTDRRPNVHHSKIKMKVIDPDRKIVQKLIVDLHDYYRAKVDPPASNMLKMRWDRRAAKDAQRWADECLVLQHDSPQGRWVNGFGSCGQNIFISTRKVPWLFAIKTWWLEKDLFNYGQHAYNNLTLVGHYTQLVWAPTHRVGCGLNECTMEQNGRRIPYFTYICNYCPIGNFPDRLGIPYQHGKTCSACKDNCKTFRNSFANIKRKAKEARRRKDRLNHPLMGFGSKKARSRSRSKSRPKRQSEKKMCTNSCPVADLWSNCQDLVQKWPDWMCQQRNNTEGRNRYKNCQATCSCDGSIKN